MYFSKATIIAFAALLSQGLAADCATVRSDCQSSGDPNQAECASLAAQCCDQADNACRVGPDANMATCSAEKASCYASASLPDPYATSKRDETNCATVRAGCQSQPSPNQAYCASQAAKCCETKDNACRTGDLANMATCSAAKAQCYADASLPDPYATASKRDADGEECAAVRSDCQSQPDANQAGCASQAAECCTKKDNACRTAPDANMASCSAAKSSCYAAASLPDPYAN
ncbi:hypothetical protein J7T55_000194 [Diaporthe amygdali]|uniref:uncharacterized protein n=1 Tax=Phomopsis amygdali TaxID=1214568 RepID=UPI0022FEEFD1|nr:uncharacterized protein J7T55_000194 [Diaporthe amygdali]KAJ0108229.1 hypothetical protein J7T55_000194 [Diaporthe amygdali]